MFAIYEKTKFPLVWFDLDKFDPKKNLIEFFFILSHFSFPEMQTMQTNRTANILNMVDIDLHYKKPTR